MSPAIFRTISWLDSRAVTRAFQIVALISLIASLFVGVQQYRLAGCLADYSDRASAATGQRAEANASTNDAIDKMIRTIANTGLLPKDKQPAAVAMAFQAYLQSRAAADEQRKLNPLPDPPSETCH
jgi:maltose-binding protein MalE